MASKREITYSWIPPDHVVNSFNVDGYPHKDIVRRKVIQSFSGITSEPAEYVSLPQNWLRVRGRTVVYYSHEN